MCGVVKLLRVECGLMGPEQSPQVRNIRRESYHRVLLRATCITRKPHSHEEVSRPGFRVAVQTMGPGLRT